MTLLQTVNHHFKGLDDLRMVWNFANFGGKSHPVDFNRAELAGLPVAPNSMSFGHVYRKLGLQNSGHNGLTCNACQITTMWATDTVKVATDSL